MYCAIHDNYFRFVCSCQLLMTVCQGRQMKLAGFMSAESSDVVADSESSFVLPNNIMSSACSLSTLWPELWLLLLTVIVFYINLFFVRCRTHAGSEHLTIEAPKKEDISVQVTDSGCGSFFERKGVQITTFWLAKVADYLCYEHQQQQAFGRRHFAEI